MSLLQRGCIKSIQRIIKTVNTHENDSIDVGINYVNIDKTFIIMNDSGYYDNVINGYVTFNSNTSIKISMVHYENLNNTVTFCIQIIEFY